MRELWERVIARHGQTVTLTRRGTGEAVETRAFLQPDLKNREDLPVTATPLGPVSDQRWLYLGSAGVELAPGDSLAYGTLRLITQEVQTFYWGDEALYCRATLRREKEAAE